MPRMPADRDVMRAPKGMLDVLPPESSRWVEVVTRFASRAQRFGYGLLLTPIVEHYEVFARVGETTDLGEEAIPAWIGWIVQVGESHLLAHPARILEIGPGHRAEVPRKLVSTLQFIRHGVWR